MHKWMIGLAEEMLFFYVLAETLLGYIVMGPYSRTIPRIFLKFFPKFTFKKIKIRSSTVMTSFIRSAHRGADFKIRNDLWKIFA